MFGLQYIIQLFKIVPAITFRANLKLGGLTKLNLFSIQIFKKRIVIINFGAKMA